MTNSLFVFFPSAVKNSLLSLFFLQCVQGRPIKHSPVLNEKLLKLQKRMTGGHRCDLMVLGCLWEWVELVMCTRELRGEMTVECLLHGKELLDDVAPGVVSVCLGCLLFVYWVFVVCLLGVCCLFGCLLAIIVV